ncbi:MAG: hypothetical protein ACJA1R_001554, partial [Flavobacteriales bacterium]
MLRQRLPFVALTVCFALGCGGGESPDDGPSDAEDVAITDVTERDNGAEDTAPEDTTPEDTTPEDTTPEDTTPE